MNSNIRVIRKHSMARKLNKKMDNLIAVLFAFIEIVNTFKYIFVINRITMI